MEEENCPCCKSRKTVTGDCFGAGGTEIAFRFVPEDRGGWWEAIKHTLGAAGVAFGSQRFRMCTECGHLWINLPVGNERQSEDRTQ